MNPHRHETEPSSLTTVQHQASRHLWNPMARMADVIGQQRVWVTGKGSLLYDERGREFVDGCGGLWYANVGYGREEIVEAVSRQMRALPAWMLFGNNVTPSTAELAERLAGLTPGDLNHVYFTTGGAEAVETAFKISRQYFKLEGQATRYKVICRRGAYHGSSFGALACTGTPHNRRMFEPLPSGFVHVDPFSLEDLETAIAFESPETIAAFLFDPVMAAAGLRLPEDDYFRRVGDLCAQHGILLIADEIVSAFGRIGEWFGVSRWHVVPDIIVMAKGLTSGYLPLGGVAVSERIFEPFASRDNVDAGFFQGPTYSGHATCCAAGLANIAILEEEALLQRSRDEGVYLHEALLEAVSSSASVREVRSGGGLVAAVELDAPAASGIAQEISDRAFDHGALIRPLTGNTLTFSPPLVISREQIDRLCDALRAALGSVDKRRTRRPVSSVST